MERAGVATQALPQAPAGVEFGIQQMDVASALAGHGVAMASPLLFATELATKRLVQPFDTVVRDGKDHWLVHASSRQRLKKVQSFKAWVLKEAAQMQLTER